MRSILALLAMLVSPLSIQAVTIDTVLIGNPGNDPDPQLPHGLFGRVTTTYRIGVTDVTNAQYAEFLNAVAASDPYGLYHTFMDFSTKGGITRSGTAGSYTYATRADALVEEEGGSSYTYTYSDKPVVFVSWYDAIRFVNWLHNGQGSGDTESGAYTLGQVDASGVPINGDSITRNAGAKWFLPTESEWYKAAYYDGDAAVYYDYPTGTDMVPNNNLPSADTGNSANFHQDDPTTETDTTTGNLDYPHTAAGAYTLSASPYGTLDQAGNNWEWNQTLIGAGLRGRRGGAWNSDSTMLAASHQGSLFATFQIDSLGFRVASIPEADSLAGDFNDDGAVDAADYVVWRKTGGSQDEYNEWRAGLALRSEGDKPGTPPPSFFSYCLFSF